MHPGQLRVTPAAVRALVDRQFPAWRRLPVTAVASRGTVNALFRIGDGLVARFPLQPAAEPDGGRARIEGEAAAARELFGRTRFATPEPVAIGEPGAGYPQAWSVQTWVPGTSADEATTEAATEATTGGSAGFAHDVAEFIDGVRSIPLAGRRFRGDGRGGDLHTHDAWVQLCLDRSADLLDVPRLRSMWRDLRDLPADPGGDVMSHRDLIPGNVLVSAGRLTGVIDVDALGPADPALDLVAGWHPLAAGPRAVFRDDLGSGEVQWRRGMAWALAQAVGLVWYYRDSNPAMSAMGRRTLQRLASAE